MKISKLFCLHIHEYCYEQAQRDKIKKLLSLKMISRIWLIQLRSSYQLALMINNGSSSVHQLFMVVHGGGPIVEEVVIVDILYMCISCTCAFSYFHNADYVISFGPLTSVRIFRGLKLYV